jgi:hypothetical protein
MKAQNNGSGPLRLSLMVTFAASLTVPALYAAGYTGTCTAPNGQSYSLSYTCQPGWYGVVTCSCTGYSAGPPPQWSGCGPHRSCFQGGGGGS